MVNYYDELEIEDFAWDPVARVFHSPCPCGDRFEISKSQLRNGEEIATCPSCSLIVRVIYDYLDWEDYISSDEDEDSSSTSSIEEQSALAGVNLSDAVATPQIGGPGEKKVEHGGGNENQEVVESSASSLAASMGHLQVDEPPDPPNPPARSQ
ncbi:hypothetical protein BCR39DRAFT_564122 [Naematelia encephala]|uniref:Diphthamide biosynthesis protein 3 n=1 Tax=Naematelia encephala TaxID=71784 RepID=A0A1Y2BDC4_9TREE|nr:hypothetical protein BCR39DRAFT_564122 [Naematelia encephala]